VTLKRLPWRRLDYARPFWQLSDDYVTHETSPFFAGDLPVDSVVVDGRLKYRFAFRARDGVKDAALILDPRCARGIFDLHINGVRTRRGMTFPLDGIDPVRVPLRRLRNGRNTIELRFDARSATDGLLSQLYIVGNFDVDVEGVTPAISAPTPCIPRDGWQAAGMPHYMGRGRYRWTEMLARNEAGPDWTLELDGVVDSADLRVNGCVAGRRAWAPWRWDLPELKPGANRFELCVYGTAGNKHKLDWPNQAQGWIGGGRLSRMPDARD